MWFFIFDLLLDKLYCLEKGSSLRYFFVNIKMNKIILKTKKMKKKKKTRPVDWPKIGTGEHFLIYAEFVSRILHILEDDFIDFVLGNSDFLQEKYKKAYNVSI